MEPGQPPAVGRPASLGAKRLLPPDPNTAVQRRSCQPVRPVLVGRGWQCEIGTGSPSLPCLRSPWPGAAAGALAHSPVPSASGVDSVSAAGRRAWPRCHPRRPRAPHQPDESRIAVHAQRRLRLRYVWRKNRPGAAGWMVPGAHPLAALLSSAPRHAGSLSAGRRSVPPSSRRSLPQVTSLALPDHASAATLLQPNGDSGALADGAGDADRPVVLLDDPPDDGQPEAGPPALAVVSIWSDWSWPIARSAQCLSQTASTAAGARAAVHCHRAAGGRRDDRGEGDPARGGGGRRRGTVAGRQPPGGSRHQRVRAVVATFRLLAGALRLTS